MKQLNTQTICAMIQSLISSSLTCNFSPTVQCDSVVNGKFIDHTFQVVYADQPVHLYTLHQYTGGDDEYNAERLQTGTNDFIKDLPTRIVKLSHKIRDIDLEIKLRNATQDFNLESFLTSTAV